MTTFAEEYAKKLSRELAEFRAIEERSMELAVHGHILIRLLLGEDPEDLADIFAERFGLDEEHSGD